MKRTALACIMIGVATAVAGDSLPVTDDAVFVFQGREITISRSTAPDTSTLAALTTDNCTAPCLSSMSAADGVATLGELDVITFLSTQVQTGDGLLIDARVPQARAVGYIPASVNIPAATLAPENPYRNEILAALGATQFEGISDFSAALSLVVYDAGPATQDAQSLILDLLSAGYPAEKIAYYRGGLQVWATLGLSVARGES